MNALKEPLVSVLSESDEALDDAASQGHLSEFIRLEEPPVETPVSALSAGLERAQGDLIIYLRRGDSLLPGALEKLARVLAEQPRVSFAYPAFYRLKGNSEEAETVIPEEFDLPEMLRWQDIPIGPGAIFRRDQALDALQLDAVQSPFGEFAFWAGLAAKGMARRLLEPLARRRESEWRTAHGSPETARERLRMFESLTAELELPAEMGPSLRSGGRSACILAALEIGPGNGVDERFYVVDRFAERLSGKRNGDIEAESAHLEARIAILEQRLARHQAVIPLIESTVLGRERHAAGHTAQPVGRHRRLLARMRGSSNG